MAVTPINIVRVSTNLQSISLLDTLRRNTMQLFLEQNRMATGEKLNAPSEDPVLAALGINSFFSGRDGSDIGINALLTATGGGRLLAAGQGGGPGDGSNAAAMTGLGTDSLSGLGGQSLNDFYNTIATRIAVKGAAAMAAVDAADAITMGLIAQRESVSGVNLDEETISLMRLQRSFQGAARYATTVNELLQELLGLLG